ncbi:MAG: response regulator [Gemmatimonadetes bacterium]|nr:response regulator [Gemmatimonadota bacterium]
MPRNSVSILLIEDDPFLRDALRLLLEEAGYRVREAASVAQALELAAAEPPSLVILDLGLPDGPGLEVVRALRERPATQDVPVVALTGRVGPEEEQACRQAGCRAYWAKPLPPLELLRRIPELLQG